MILNMIVIGLRKKMSFDLKKSQNRNNNIIINIVAFIAELSTINFKKLTPKRKLQTWERWLIKVQKPLCSILRFPPLKKYGATF